MTTGSNELVLEWLPGRYAVCGLNAGDVVPPWAQAAAKRSPAPGRRQSNSSLLSITRTDRELSIVIEESRVPDNVRAERGFIALRIKGTLDFSIVGVLAKLTGALAAANVPVFVISTFETDVILIREGDQQRVVAALKSLAHIAPGMPGAH
jgi:hypothetical protein